MTTFDADDCNDFCERCGHESANPDCEWCAPDWAHMFADDEDDDCLGCGVCDDCIAAYIAHYEENEGQP